MSTQAQILANQANAQLSTGPTSDAGKAKSSKNNLRHGLTGPFVVLSWENQDDSRTLLSEFFAEHQPTTLTEEVLVQDMSQSHWLRKRAVTLQHMCFSTEVAAADQPKELALYLRYQTTHDRAFYKALNELQKLRAEKRKEERDEAALHQRAEDSRIGFVSQERQEAEEARRKLNDQRKEAQEKRRENEETRRQEMHNARVWLAEAQARRHETEAAIAELTKMPRSSEKHASSNVAKAA